MSYDDCGAKSFVDTASACGEFEERTCDSGKPTQNSYRMLVANVGLRATPAAPAEEEPEEEEEEEVWEEEEEGDGWGDEGDADSGSGSGSDSGSGFDSDSDAGSDADAGSDEHGGCGVADEQPRGRRGRSITLDTGGDTLAGDRWISIRAHASARRGVADVELWWATPDGEYAWSCAAPPDDAPVRCTRDGDDVTFHLNVGTGLRTVAAVMVDHRGRRTFSDARTLTLE